MKCWSCGTEIPGGGRYIFTCPTCSMVEEQKKIRERLEYSESKGIYEAVELFGPDIGEVVGILEAGFGGLSEQLSEIATGIASVASILEWGFEEIEWKLDQIRGTLKSIDKTLKSPSKTQANEWRQMAEELRRRGVLDGSEKFFLKSFEMNPLDYRTYIGLGKTYLQIGKGDKTRTYWEKSLLHAPKGEINYKSYSYRLIGRLDFCEDNPQEAASLLKTAIELSPNYYLGHYDYAQCCALIGDKENCLSSLQTAIVKEPIPFELVEKERNFKPFSGEVENLLKEISSNRDLRREIKARLNWRGASKKIYFKLDKAERLVKEADDALSETLDKEGETNQALSLCDRLLGVERKLDKYRYLKTSFLHEYQYSRKEIDYFLREIEEEIIGPALSVIGKVKNLLQER